MCVCVCELCFMCVCVVERGVSKRGVKLRHKYGCGCEKLYVCVLAFIHFCRFIVVCLCVCLHGFNYSIGILYVLLFIYL